MDDTPPDGQLPPSLRFLKWLVTALMVTMIAGVITVVWLLVTRMPDGSPSWPATLALPEGATPLAVTQGPGWTAVVTTDGRILILNPDGSLRQEVKVEPAP